MDIFVNSTPLKKDKRLELLYFISLQTNAIISVMFYKQMGVKYKTHRNLVAIPRFKVFSAFSLVLKTNLLVTILVHLQAHFYVASASTVFRTQISTNGISLHVRQ